MNQEDEDYIKMLSYINEIREIRNIIQTSIENQSMREKLAHDYCMSVISSNQLNIQLEYLIKDGFEYADLFIKKSKENGK